MRLRRPEEETVKKAAKRPARKPAKKPARILAKKSAKKPLRKSAPAQKAAAKAPAKAAAKAPAKAARPRKADRPKVLEQLRSRDVEIRRLMHISALLSWDQETYMPPKAVGERSEQLELLSGAASTGERGIYYSSQ